MALRDLCGPNPCQLETPPGACCAAAAENAPEGVKAVCSEPDAVASAEREVEGNLSIPEGSDAWSLVQV
jgi:hypothetical protein